MLFGLNGLNMIPAKFFCALYPDKFPHYFYDVYRESNLSQQ